MFIVFIHKASICQSLIKNAEKSLSDLFKSQNSVKDTKH